MRSAAAWLGLAIVAALAATISLQGTDPAPPTPASGATGAAAGAGPAAVAGATAGRAQADAPGDDVPGNDAPLRAPASPAAPSGGPRVQVLHPGGAPAPEAWVAFLSRDECQRRRAAADGRDQPPYELVDESGQRARTDADGRVALPGTDSPWVVVARAGDGFGVLAAAASGDHVLQLARDEQVEIYARFADGAAAAVPVAVCQQRTKSDSKTLWSGETGADGRATIQHFQLLREDAGSEREPAAEERFAAVLRVPTTPRVLTEFDGRRTTDDAIELRVPDLGKLEVQLLCHTGVPLLSAARVGFGAAARSRDEDAFPVSRRLLHRSVGKPVGAAAVELPYAQLGRPHRVYARFPGARRTVYATTPEATGSRGAVARVEISPHPEHAVLAGRLLLEGGGAVGDTRATLTIWRGERVQYTTTVTTIADGRWDCVVTGRSDADDWRVELRLERPDAPTDDEGATGAFGAVVALGPWPGGARCEVGDVLLQPLPALAAGVVVDDLGAPVAGAMVTVEQEVPAAAPATQQLGQRSVLTLSSRSRTNRSRGLRAPSGPTWRGIRALTTTTDADGAFQLAGFLPPGKLRVRADTRLHLAETRALAQPAGDLRFVLARNGVFGGRVVLPGWLPDRAVTVTLTPRADEQGRARSERVKADGGGRFAIEPLRQGVYDATITMRGLQEPLVLIPDVLIRPGDQRDPRLDPVDLTAALFRYELRARDAGGRAMDLDGPIHARLQGRDGSWSEAGFRWQGGRAELITAHPVAELTFFGRGFAPLRQVYAPGTHDVYLRTHRPALVDVSGARSLSGPDRKVRISAILKGDTGYPSSLSGTDQLTGRRFWFPRWDLGRSSGGWLGATDLVEIPLMQAGKYELIFRAHANETTRTPQTQVSLGVFELTPGGATTTTVELPSQQVVDALQQLDRKWQQQQEQRSGAPRQRSRD